MDGELIVGVISDTHGLLRPEAMAELAGSNLIIHAGDIGSPDILPALGRIAPVHAVRGNIDKQAWTASLPLVEIVGAGERLIYVLHDLGQLDLDPRAAGFAAVICGHSHVPRQETRAGVLYFNPGSAGPRRFNLPISMGRLRVKGGHVRGELVVLQPGA